MSDYLDHTYVLILAGGGGTRLWPKSREKTPKQFLKIFRGKTLTQMTCERLNEQFPLERMYCITVSEDYKKEFLREVPEFKKENIIVEPARRDTGPAHAVGALYIYSKDPDAVIITEAADRLVNPVKRYLNTLKAAAKVAYEEKCLITIGVEPRYPHTGLGYIKKGKKYSIDHKREYFKVDKFVEKPEMELAKKYVASGDYYWNAGQFIWRADSILASVEKFSPDIYKNVLEIKDSLGKSNEKEQLKKSYESMQKISIDYAVAEKDQNMYVFPSDFFWTDIGDWKEVWENLPKDDQGNVIIDGEEPGGRVINVDTTDALIHTDGKLIAVVDVDNVVIIDSKDVLLVCSKSRAQSVKKIVELLKTEGNKELL